MARSKKPTVWIEKRKNRSGYVMHSVRAEKDGIRFPTIPCGTDKQAAIETRDKLRADLWAGRLGLTKVATRELGEFLEQVLVYSKSHKAENTWRNFDEPTFKSLTAYFGKRRDLASLHREELEEWKMSLLEAKLGATTVGMRVRSAKSAFSYGMRLGILTVNPAVGVEVPKTEAVGRVLMPAEIQHLIDFLPNILSRALWFALQTGVRQAELIALDWRWIRGNTAELQVTKGGRPRVVHLNTQALGAMGAPRTEGIVFAGVTRDVIHSNLVRVCRAQALGRVRWHDLRHTWATEYMRRTGDLPGLMLEGGWSSLTAVAVYQHLSRGRALAPELIDYGVTPLALPSNVDSEGPAN